MLLQPFSAETLTVQSGINVRIFIAGLALCNKDASGVWQIDFLRNVPNHVLKIKIITRGVEGAPTKPADEYTITAGLHSIELKPSAANPVSVEDELPLSCILNLKKLHRGNGLARKLSSPDNFTRLSLYNCELYTKRITANEFEIYEVTRPDQKLIAVRQFGDVIGGFISCADNGTTMITCPGFGASPIRLPQNDGSENAFYYDIYFNNACNETDLCKAHSATLGNKTDFLYYYRLIKDSVTLGKEIEIRKKAEPDDKKDLKSDDNRGTGVEACNPVIENDDGHGGG